jgi:hypothetical protein
MPQIVKRCSCKHEFQDTRYKRGNRVHTVGEGKITCTVCGQVTKMSNEEIKKYPGR